MPLIPRRIRRVHRDRTRPTTGAEAGLPPVSSEAEEAAGDLLAGPFVRTGSPDEG